MTEQQFIDLLRQLRKLQREVDGLIKPEIPLGPDALHAAFIGLEDNAGTDIDPDVDDRIQVTDDGVINADASGNDLALSIDQSQISHDSIGGVSEDDHHAAFIGLSDNADTSINPAVDNRIQITDDSVINADASGNTLALSVDQSQISHDSISDVSEDDHHAAFIGLSDNADTSIDPAADNRIQVTDDGKVNADASGNTLALSIDESQLVGGSIPAPGSDTEIIFNDGGVFGADSDFTWDKTNNVLSLTSTNGIDINPGSDTDADLITVGVTDTPTFSWDESESAFALNKSLDINVAEKGEGLTITTNMNSADNTTEMLRLEANNAGAGNADVQLALVNNLAGFEWQWRTSQNNEGMLFTKVGTSGSEMLISNTGATFRDSELQFAGSASIGDNTSPSAQLHIDQRSATGAMPVLYLNQADVSEQLIHGSSDGNDVDINIITLDVTGTPTFWWDESEDRFVLNKDLDVNGVVISDLSDFGSLTPDDGNFIVGDGANWITESGNTARTSLGLGTGDSPTFAGLSLTGNSIISKSTPRYILENTTPFQWAIEVDAADRFIIRDITSGGIIWRAVSGIGFRVMDAGTNKLEFNDANNDYDYRFLGTNDNDLVRIDAGNDRVGIGIPSPNAKLHIDQSSATGAIPALFLDQADVSEQAIFVSYDGADVDMSIVELDVTGGPIFGWDESEDSFTLNKGLDVTGSMDATTVTGANVTSGADPGHTHTGSSVGSISHDTDLVDVSADDHHSQQHDITGADHTASGLAVGEVIRATGATTFAWATLQHADLGALQPDDHHAEDHASRHITGGADEIDGDQIDIDWTPSNYTPSTSPAEASNVDHLTAHLAGIDDELGTLGGGGAPGGSDTHVQYNSSGSFAGESNFTYDDTDKLVNVNDSSGGDVEIENTGTGGASFNDWVGGLNLVAGNLASATSLYPSIRWMSKDSSFTTENPKITAQIAVGANEDYSGDNDGGTDMSFFVHRNNPGSSPTFGSPRLRLFGEGPVRVEQPHNVTIAALELIQANIESEFIIFDGDAASATLNQSLVAEGDVTTATREGWVRISINDNGNQITDGAYYIPFFSLA